MTAAWRQPLISAVAPTISTHPSPKKNTNATKPIIGPTPCTWDCRPCRPELRDDDASRVRDVVAAGNRLQVALEHREGRVGELGGELGVGAWVSTAMIGTSPDSSAGTRVLRTIASGPVISGAVPAPTEHA